MNLHQVGWDERRARTALWIGIGLTAAVCAIAVGVAAQRRRRHHRALHPVRDYSGRRGFPLPVQEMRGAARWDFETPEDMRAQPALRVVDSA